MALLLSLLLYFSQFRNFQSAFNYDLEKIITCLYYHYNRTLGTPDDSIWPGVTKMIDYKSTFPKWPARDLNSVIYHRDENCLDLVKVYEFVNC